MESITVGLVPSPQLPTQIVNKLIDRLEEDLYLAFSEEIKWKVEMQIDRLTGAADKVEEILNEAKYLKKENNWDYTISLTDLPVFHHKCVVLADADIEGKSALISLPAFGLAPTVKRVKMTMIHLFKELYYRNVENKDRINFIQKGIGIKEDAKSLPALGRLMKAFGFSTIERINLPPKEDGISIRFLIKPKWGALPIILSGMTIANQPWSIMPSFKKVVGLAFATGSYMLIFTTLWQLSSLYGLMRLILVMCFAIGSMTIWTIMAHDLWEGQESDNSKGYRFIYNVSTVLTLLVAIIVFYIFLFCLFLLAVAMFVPPDMFQTVVEHDVEVKDYIILVWLITSAATVAGAIGAGFENAEQVRESTYGYRQYIRSKAIEETKKEEEKYEEK